MNKNSNNTFINSLLDPISHLFPVSSFTRGLTREAGIHRTFYSFGNGDVLTGTDQDDTIVIKRDLTGGAPKSSDISKSNDTEIHFMDGNDSLTIGGKISVQNNQHLSIDSTNGSTTISAGSIEGKSLAIGSPNKPYVSINLAGAENSLLIKGDINSTATLKANNNRDDPADFLSVSMSKYEENAHNVMKVGGSLTANRTKNHIDLFGHQNELLIDEGLTATNFSSNEISLTGTNNTVKVGGNIAVSNGSMVNVSVLGDPVDDQHTTNSFSSGDITVTNNSYFFSQFYADINDLIFGKLSAAANQSNITINVTSNGNYKATSNVLVKGDIEAQESNSINMYLANFETALEVTGVVSTKTSGYEGCSIYIETSEGNDTLKFDKGFSLVGADEINVKSGAGDDNVIVGGGISMQDNSADRSAYFNLELQDGNDSFTLTGNIANASGFFGLDTGTGNDTVTINGDVLTQIQVQDLVVPGSHFFLGEGDDVFSLTGNLTATKGTNYIYGDDGNDTISITGNVTAYPNGHNVIDCGEGDDTVILNGRINAGALEIDGGAGHDTLVLTAANSNEFVSDYKDWLNDLSSTDALSKSNIETIRLDVNDLQTSKLGWFTDIINKANANGANIAIEDKNGHAIGDVHTYLAQDNDTHNPINDVLDQYAPTAANAAQPKAFAEHLASPSTDAFTAPHFDNNFLHEMEQQAQAHSAAAA